MTVDVAHLVRGREVPANRRAARRRRRLADAAHRAMLDRNPQSPTVAVAGVTQTTGVLAFNFRSS